MSDEKPPEKPTVEFEKPPAWAISMMERQQEAFADLRGDISTIGEKVDNVEKNMGLLTGEVGVVQKEVAVLFQWKTDVDERMRSHSVRARQPSEQDLENASQLAQERAAREALAAEHAEVKKDVQEIKAETIAQTQIMISIRDGAKKLLDRPEVKWLAAALWMAFTAWLATKGIK